MLAPPNDSPANFWKQWADTTYLTELVTLAAPDGEISVRSKLRKDHLGKIPAKRNTDGTWSGLTGWTERSATLGDAKNGWRWGANVGLQTRIYTALDIDVDAPELADAIEELARDCLGFAPVRWRKNSARRLMLYRKPADHPPIRKRRLAWQDTNGRKGAVERLAHGQQTLVAGRHPSGAVIEWREWHPCERGSDSLTEVDEATWSRFFNA